MTNQIIYVNGTTSGPSTHPGWVVPVAAMTFLVSCTTHAVVITALAGAFYIVKVFFTVVVEFHLE